MKSFLRAFFKCFLLSSACALALIVQSAEAQGTMVCRYENAKNDRHVVVFDGGTSLRYSFGSTPSNQWDELRLIDSHAGTNIQTYQITDVVYGMHVVLEKNAHLMRTKMTIERRAGSGKVIWQALLKDCLINANESQIQNWADWVHAF